MLGSVNGWFRWSLLRDPVFSIDRVWLFLSLLGTNHILLLSSVRGCFVIVIDARVQMGLKTTLWGWFRDCPSAILSLHILD